MKRIKNKFLKLIGAYEYKYGYGGRHYKVWYCQLMNILDFRYWFCECEYMSPYGLVIMGGCEKHD